ncbi:MAG: FAD-dependent oxidoreductase [Oscillospiraceae bacterium]|nr:FAD-dependent oxidoreductase [Oscillospiraceae bacterium]
MNPFYPHLFESFSVKGLTFRNRLFSAPNMMCSMDINGSPTPDMIAYYAEKARGGAAVVTIGDTPVDREHAASNPRSFSLTYENLPFLSEMAMAIHEGGALASLELNHAGRAVERGHDVTLCERSDKLGGFLKFTDYDDLKIDLFRLKEHLIYMCECSGAKILLNTEVTPEYVKDGGFDALILAAGSLAAKPPIPGLDDPRVQHATVAYTQLDKLGHHVAVLGGGLIGCETALFLAKAGHDVTIVEMLEEIAPEANWMHKEGMMQAFAETPQLHVRTGLKVTGIEDGRTVHAVDATGQEQIIQADSVIYALGLRSNMAAYESLLYTAPEVIPVGDCLRGVKAKKTREAMLEGYWAAVRL